MTSRRLRVLAGLLCLCVLSSCTARQKQLSQQLDAEAEARRQEQQALRDELASISLRQQLQADRLRRAEEELVRLRAELVAAREQPVALGRRPGSDSTGRAGNAAAASEPIDAAAVYAEARALFGDRRYDEARALFARIVAEAPRSGEADNAQYWIGECHYGAGRYRQALEEFARVASYEKTEKDDDAQLKIARCHLSLGNKDEAIAAFRTLLSQYPDSEYVEAARRELRYLGGP